MKLEKSVNPDISYIGFNMNDPILGSAAGERGKKLKDFFFMARIKAPGGGSFSAAQWVALDDAADRFADGTIRITSRQGIQYHHIYGPNLAPLIRHLNRNYRDHGTLGGCGDVNRNVMASPVDGLDPTCDVASRELVEVAAPYRGEDRTGEAFTDGTAKPDR